MIRKFLRDRGGNYAMLTGLAMLPIMGGIAIAVDFSEMNRQKQATVNALDAAGLATARQVASGVSDEALIAYCRERLSGFKCPRGISFLDELPRNETGKLPRHALTALLASQLG